MGILQRAALIFTSPQKRQALLESAVVKGDHAAAGQLLDTWLSPDFPMQGQEPGTTPLIYAARQGDIAMMRLLLAARADPLLLPGKGTFNAWQSAAAHGRTAAVALLLDAGVDINAGPERNSALVLAAANDHAETVRLLCEKRVDVNLPGEHGYSPLHWACRRRNPEVAKILLEHGAHADAMTEKGLTPLMMLCRRSRQEKQQSDAEAAQKEVLSLLLAANPPLEQRSWTGETVLHRAIREKAREFACALILAGADAQTANKEGKTPLDLAAAMTDGAFQAALQNALREKKEKDERARLRKLTDVRTQGALRPLRRIRLRPGAGNT